MNGSNSFLLIGAVQVGVWLLFAIAGLVILIMAYTRTKLGGFLWLIAAVIVWPTITRIVAFSLGFQMPRLAGSRAMTAAQIGGLYTLINVGETVVGGSLLLTALILLSIGVGRRFPPTPPQTYAPDGSLRER